MTDAPEPNDPSPGAPPESQAKARRTEELAKAFRNALRLGGSLILSWCIALVVRFFVPRHFGPELFGTFNLADAITLSGFTFLSLGIDTHIQITVSVDKRAANAYLGTITILRIAMSLLLFAGVAAVLHWNHRPPAVQQMGVFLGVGYLFNALSGSFSAILMAYGTVGTMSAVNVVSKLGWGLGIAIVISTGSSVQGLAIAFMISEVARTTALAYLARREADFEFRWNPAEGKKALLASLPFYLNTVAVIVYGKIDVNTMMALTTDTEIGWYSSAANIASLALLLAPITQSVLGPMMARAAQHDPEELWFLVRRTTEGVFILSIPIALFITLGADLLVRVILGPSFAVATAPLRVLAPMFVLTYIAITVATALNLRNRGWTVTAISTTALLVNPAMNYFLIPYCSRIFGPGGAGTGAAITLVSVEAVVTVTLIAFVGRPAVDARLFKALGKSLAATAATVVVHVLAAPLGPVRLLLDAATYAAAAGALRIITVNEVRSLVGVFRNRVGAIAAARSA